MSSRHAWTVRPISIGSDQSCNPFFCFQSSSPVKMAAANGVAVAAGGDSGSVLAGGRKSQRLKEELGNSDAEKAAKAARENQQLVIYLFVASVIILAWVLGSLHCSFLWTFFLIVLTFMVWWNKVLLLTEKYIKEKEMLVHRRRALRQSETTEWLNFIINRWWAIFAFFFTSVHDSRSVMRSSWSPWWGPRRNTSRSLLLMTLWHIALGLLLNFCLAILLHRSHSHAKLWCDCMWFCTLCLVLMSALPMSLGEPAVLWLSHLLFSSSFTGDDILVCSHLGCVWRWFVPRNLVCSTANVSRVYWLLNAGCMLAYLLPYHKFVVCPLLMTHCTRIPPACWRHANQCLVADFTAVAVWPSALSCVAATGIAGIFVALRMPIAKALHCHAYEAGVEPKWLAICILSVHIITFVYFMGSSSAVF